MKVSVSRSALAATIGNIQGVVSSKPAIPILANILIEARDSSLILTATDLTVGMHTEIDATVTQPGAITLPARRFFQLVRELTTSTIEIEASTEEVATIRAGSARFRLCGMHKSEFPTLPNLMQAIHFDIAADKLKGLLSHSSFAAAREDSRQVLNGVLMRLKEGKAVFAGTDGKRLAKLTTSVDIEDSHHHDYILPLKAVEEMIKLLNEEENITVRALPDKMSIESASAILITHLISGDYPDIERIIPKATALSVQLHREELMALLKQISLFTPDKGNSVQFTFQQGELKLTANSSDIGEGEVSMPVDYKEDKLDIAFNPLFFYDVLRHCRDETVSLSLTDPYNPGLITDSREATFVIMPMRLQSPVA